jgi:hypothetical protein
VWNDVSFDVKMLRVRWWGYGYFGGIGLRFCRRVLGAGWLEKGKLIFVVVVRAVLELMLALDFGAACALPDVI